MIFHNIKPRAWFVSLHERFQHDFTIFKDTYQNKERFRFGINYSGELNLWDSVHLYLLIKEVQPENILIIGGGNGYTESLVASASDGSFNIASYEKHPGPRIAANQRADYFGYKNHLKQLTEITLVEDYDFIIIMQPIKKFPVLRRLKNKCVLYFNGEHFNSEKVCSHIKEYIMPDPGTHKDLLLGSWWDLLNYWDYEPFKDNLFNQPHSTALFVG